MAVDGKYEYNSKKLLRDTRPLQVKFTENAKDPSTALVIFLLPIVLLFIKPLAVEFADLILIAVGIYFWWLYKVPIKGKYRTPQYADGKKGDGIMYVGNERSTKKELWLNNSDARTHILYLGTTGSGKTEGLKSLVSNAMTWGSGFVYIDGKADTDLWASIYALARRFGRDDDLLILNYMTGNKDGGAISNTLNPFATGSASYLTNMMVGLMPAAGGDTAMWKDRAVSLLGSLMPALTYKRDYQGMLLDVQVVREHVEMKKIIQMSRDPGLPDRIKRGLNGYLTTLPGYQDACFDDNGEDRPPGPNVPNADMTTTRQQHGYLTMQFTRSLQSLADEYGNVFKVELADIDLTDVVLNRRIVLALIPALEKSGDEAANLGKIIVANLKGMMGSTLGSEVEGDHEAVIENKPTKAPSPFITIFDEVGYYTAEGMAVMAAQARSLGFSLIFAAQDLPALEKRVKEEARSITANCNLKIFGKLEDPTQTREFFENTVGMATISKAGGHDYKPENLFSSYRAQTSIGIGDVKKATYGELRTQKEGEAHITFMADTIEVKMFYANPPRAKALRINRLLKVNPKVDETLRDPGIESVLKRLQNPKFSALRSFAPAETSDEISLLAEGFKIGYDVDSNVVKAGIIGLSYMAEKTGILNPVAEDEDEDLSFDSLFGGDSDKDSGNSGGMMSGLPKPAKSEKVEEEEAFDFGKLFSGFDEEDETTTANTDNDTVDDEDPFAELFNELAAEEEMPVAEKELVNADGEVIADDAPFDFGALFGSEEKTDEEDEGEGERKGGGSSKGPAPANKAPDVKVEQAMQDSAVKLSGLFGSGAPGKPGGGM